MKKTEKQLVVRTVFFEILFILIALAIGLWATRSVLIINTKIMSTQWELGSIASEIRIYNDNIQHGYYSQEDDQLAKKLMERRLELSHSEDPIIHFAAKHGFSIILFFGSIAIYGGIIFIWYLIIKNRDIIMEIGPELLEVLIKRVFLIIAFLGIFTAKTLLFLMAKLFKRVSKFSRKMAFACHNGSKILSALLRVIQKTRKNVR